LKLQQQCQYFVMIFN